MVVVADDVVLRLFACVEKTLSPVYVLVVVDVDCGVLMEGERKSGNPRHNKQICAYAFLS